MSTLKVDNIRHNSATSDAITMASDGTCTAKLTSVGGGGLSHRNKFINGAMTISQRGTSFASTLSDDQYVLDRFKHIVRGTNDSYYTQVSVHPDDFTKSMKVTCNSTYTPSASDNAGFQSMLEGQDLQDLAFGTSSAKSITISFYAKSASQNNGHQYTFQIRSYPSGGATTRIMNFPFTVTTSWQRFTFTFVGDTGADIKNDKNTGMALLWNLNAGPDDITSQYTSWASLNKYMAVTGQSNFLDNTNNEFYLTGVQLEVGDTATTFEHRSYGEELRRCERYYEVHWQNTNASNPAGSHNDGYNCICAGVNLGSYSYFPFKYRTQKRAAPSISHGGKFRILGGGSGNNKVADEFYSPSIDGCRIRVAGSGTSGQASVLEFDAANNNGEGYIAVTAEL